jgi:hypothetical protein
MGGLGCQPWAPAVLSGCRRLIIGGGHCFAEALILVISGSLAVLWHLQAVLAYRRLYGVVR